ncbi:caspase [Thecamonas trahens ATCC 50062]|uniref:Protein CASP n=1 Tax=Thecamonas trahens ATCC 50062 TaxID=461836 RepID=A0A0L0DP75_THETB|nr:caspase [Thecamonas trahens ATCC 50062]KNC53841.1 caspase [Thecamonas trahens ATCC 50062]|eukprot:XP_013754222.1 caspase [Thecamonas trahens ATCC 50062]
MASTTTLQSLTTALVHWQNFGLSAQRESLDSAGEKIAANQDASSASRKSLAAATKAFNKSSEGNGKADDGGEAGAGGTEAGAGASKPKSKPKFAVLLRKYQKEIDALTVRARFAEKHFLGLYKDLAEVPDPAPLLELSIAALRDAAADNAADELAAENARLQAELQANAAEFASLRNQDVTIARLEKEVRELSAELDGQVTAKSEEVVAVLEAEYEAKAALLAEREARTRAQMAAMEEDYARLRAQLSTAQTTSFGESQAAQEADDVRDAQIAALSAELGRAKARVMALEAERAAAERTAGTDVGGAASAGAASDIGVLVDQVAALELELSRKDVEISDLVDELAAARDDAAAAARAAASDLARLRDQLVAKTAEVDELVAEMALAPSTDVDALLRELALLKGIEFGEETPGDAPLDALLMAKNKELEAGTAALRSSLAAAERDAADIAAERDAAAAALADKDALIAQLEADILNVSAAAAAGPQTPRAAPADAADAREAALVQALLPGSAGEARSPAQLAPPADAFAVVVAQRDRFKARVLELETENATLHERVHTARAAADALEADNLELYEKIRFLESYDDIARERDATMLRMESGELGGPLAMPAGTAGTSSAAGGAGNAGGGTGGSAELRYRKLYEDSMNPFTLFHRKQRDSSYNELNAAEKVTLNTSRILLGTKFARTFVFFYSLLLHVLVFFVLYRLSASSSTCSTASGVPSTFRPAATAGALSSATATATALASASSSASSSVASVAARLLR